MSGVRARFRLARGAFELDVDLAAPDRGVTAVFGPSGSGKTTLLRCIAGLERPRPGRLEVAGACWQDSERGVFLPPHRRRVGYVFQSAALFPHLSVRDNLRYALRRRARDARGPGFDRAVEWLGIGSLLDRRTPDLSGGERQRVAVARALVAGPRLLLLDEPLSSLDEAGRRDILPHLELLHRELAIPVVYVSHSRAEVMRLADHVVLLDGGRIRASGAVNDVAARSDLAPFADDGEIGTVADAEVARVDPAYGLSWLRVGSVELCVPEPGLVPGHRHRVRVLARDVSLAVERPTPSSILNVLPGRVVEIRDPGATLPLVAVDVGGATVLSRITRRSLDGLGVRAGAAVWAQVKSVALLS